MPSMNYHRFQEYSPPGGYSQSAAWLAKRGLLVKHLYASLSGYVSPGLKQLFRTTPMIYALGMIAMLVAGISGAVWLIGHKPGAEHIESPLLSALSIVATWTLWSLGLIVCWVLTVGGMRRCAVDFNHFGLHESLGIDKRATQILVDLSSALLLIQSYIGYFWDHVVIHHSAACATEDDPDLALLLALGFYPGQPVKVLWHVLLSNLTSPIFHGRMIAGRLKSVWGAASKPETQDSSAADGEESESKIDRGRRWRGPFAVFAHGTVLLVCAKTGHLAAYLGGWAFPALVLYNCSALLQFISEHRWLLVKDPGSERKTHIAKLTVGRFMGEAPPAARDYPKRFALRAAQIGWIARLFFVHLPARLGVMVGTLPVHDYHHRKPRSSGKNWPNETFLRRANLDAGCPGWPELFTECWGLGKAIDGFFEYFSALPPVTAKNRVSPSLTDQLSGM